MTYSVAYHSHVGGDKSTSPQGHPPNAHIHGHINVHRLAAAPPSPAAVQHQTGSMVNHAEPTSINASLLRGRSASDTNLNMGHSSPFRVQLSSAGVNLQKDLSGPSSEPPKMKMADVEVTPSASDELMVFKPVTSVGGQRQYPLPSSFASRMAQSDDGTRVISPEPADSSTSSDRSFSPPLNDSLDQPASRYAGSSMARQMKAARQQHEEAVRHRVKLTSQRRPDSGGSLQSDQYSSLKIMGISALAHTHPSSPTPPPSQPIYVCKDSDSSSNDSLDEESHSCAKHTPPRSKRRLFQQTGVTSSDATEVAPHNPNPNDCGAETQDQSSSNAEVANASVASTKPKIVGILKKTSSSSIESSQAGSATGSTLMDGTQSTTRTNGSQASNISSAKSQKRVRFVDQVRANNRYISTSHSDVWNKVLPNGFTTHHLPNSAFTPKMKLFLSSKASPIPPAVTGPPKKPTAPSTLNGFTVHIPVASVESPSPPKHYQTQKSPQGSDSDEPTIKEAELLSKNIAPSKSLEASDESSGQSTSVSKEIPSSAASDDLSSSKAPLSSGKGLDKTPTDNEINEMWEQIKTCLEENQHPSVPVHTYPFQVPVNGMQRFTSAASVGEVDHNSSAPSSLQEGPVATTTPHYDSQVTHQQPTNKTNEQNSTPAVKLVHRQSNRSRPMRCHHQPTQLPRRQQSHIHSATYPYYNQEQSQGHHQLRVHPNIQMSSREPELVVRATASTINGRISPCKCNSVC